MEPRIGIEGDYSANGRVEQADLDLVLLNWGAPTPPIPVGWVNDLPLGLVDQQELDKVLLNWGNSAPAQAGFGELSPLVVPLKMELVDTMPSPKAKAGSGRASANTRVQAMLSEWTRFQKDVPPKSITDLQAAARDVVFALTPPSPAI